MADYQFALLLGGMKFIIENSCELIIENGRSFLETNPMFGEIRPGFLSIPLKLISHTGYPFFFSNSSMNATSASQPSFGNAL